MKKSILSNYFLTSCIGNCAKCNKPEEIVNTPQPTEAEAKKLEAELLLEAKALPERKRRTFLRYLKAQEKSKKISIHLP